MSVDFFCKKENMPLKSTKSKKLEALLMS